jgi:Putative peptidoglycan binding domain
MADMTTHLMLDDVDVAITEAHDAPAFAVAGYIDGIYANWDALVAHYAGTSKFLLSISVNAADLAAGAQCLDVEPGDATVAQAPAWVKATAALGRQANDFRYYPKVYVSYDGAPGLVSALTAAGIPRNGYMLWTAHWTNVAHICGPTSCGLSIQADATQYTDTFAGASLDGSMAYGYFFSGPPVTPVPVPPPPPAPLPAWAEPSGIRLTSTDNSITASWTNEGAGASYWVQLVGIGGKLLYDESTTGTSYTFGGCSASSEYQYHMAVHPDAKHQGSPWTPLVKVSTTAPPPPPDPSKPVAEPVLQEGDTGAAVKLLQTRLNVFLNDRGAGALVLDGIFGQDTRAVVILVQQFYDLFIDGIVGPQTWPKLGNYS